MRQIYYCYASSSFSFFFLLLLFDLFVFIFFLFFSSFSLANLAKWLCVCWRTKWLCVRIPLLSLKLQIWCLLWARSSVTFRQTIECGFTLKLIRDMIITHSQMHCTDKYSQHSSIIWPVWLNVWVFVYELSSCGFGSCCCHSNICLKFLCGADW